MKLNQILQFFVPKDTSFFPLFEACANYGLEAAKKLVEMVNAADPARKAELYQNIREIEHKADEVTHQLLSGLSGTFITPFDREDIHELSTRLDDVVDYIYAAAKRIELYKIQGPNPAMEKLADVILRAAEVTAGVIPLLRNLKNPSKIRESLVLLNNLENHADDIFDNAVARLFEDEKDAIEIIKIKEVLSALETATDKAEDAANVIESIIIKQA